MSDEYYESYDPEANRIIKELCDENDRLREDNAVCRDAIEHAIELVEDWRNDDANDSDIDQGAGRATIRQLNEAIGKAVPRLLYERPEGQKLYGLKWRELRAENERLRQDAERYRFQRESDWRYRVEHYGASEDERDAYITEYDANYDAAMKEKNNES